MGFKFAARTLLELGKELISSDEVALYELIKNAIDAESPNVEIIFNVCLLHSHYQEALTGLKKNKPLKTIKDQLKSQLLLNIPSESRTTFINYIDKTNDINIFKNTLHEAYASTNWIEIRDKGLGMSLQDLDDIYLTVGTRSRRQANIHGANYLGDKGVGRLSTMRLGDYLSVKTTQAGEKCFNVLNIDWSAFSHETEKEVSDIAIEPVLGPKKNVTDEQGTVIRITNLNSDWQEARVIDLLNGSIARMIDPFQQGRGNSLLKIFYNNSRLLVPSIPPLLLRAAHATCKATLRLENGEPVFSGIIDYTAKDYKNEFDQRGAELYSITQKVFKKKGKKGHAATKIVAIRPEAIIELGPFEVEIYWYNRRTIDAITGLTGKSTETREQIATWSGGIMLFRNGFRVLPYGEADDDWLELDKNAFGQSGFLLNRQQVLGRVTVHSAHMVLSEQTNREGLIKSEASNTLIALMQWLVHVEFSNTLKVANKRDSELRLAEAEEALKDFKNEEISIQNNLNKLSETIPNYAMPVFKRVQSSIEKIVSRCDFTVKSAEKALKNEINNREKFVYLAGIGLMTEFIFHELDRSIRQTMLVLSDTRIHYPKDASLLSLEQQLVTLQKRVSAFDDMTGEQRQTKTKFNVAEIIETVIANHHKEFERHDIDYELDLKNLEIRAVKGMLVQIIENLISNSIYWLKQQAHADENFKPMIYISINAKSKILKISDNGPGVSPERRERIFEAFVTSKPPGQGRGLGLYICRELALYHDWNLTMSDNVGEYRANRLNTFKLDLIGNTYD